MTTATDEAFGWIAYEWAALRVVPRVHVEQFVNVGIVLHARRSNFLEIRLAPDWDRRLLALDHAVDIERVRRHLDSYVRIGRGDERCGPIALLPPSERFHWLTHPRSGIIQTSARHPGRTQSPGATLERLLVEQCA